MPEGVTPYPRWNGSLGHGEPWTVVMMQEIRAALRGTWSMLALVLGIGWGAASIIEVLQFRSSGADSHDLEVYTAMLDQLRWAALAVAAAVGGRSILEDARRGALELYMTRALSQRGYLLGKIAALMVLTAGVIIVPAILYYLATLIFYDSHPGGWHWAIFPALGYVLLWSVMVAGVALGLSCVARSSRAAALILFAGFAGLEIVVGGLLSGLTGNESLTIISPFVAHQTMIGWFFDVADPPTLPAWWGALYIAALTITGWALLAWRHPRVRGVDRV